MQGLSSSDKLLIGVGNICLSPLLGVILWFVWKEDQPDKASDVCTVTLITTVIFPIVIVIFMMLGGVFSYRY